MFTLAVPAKAPGKVLVPYNWKSNLTASAALFPTEAPAAFLTSVTKALIVTKPVA